MSDNNNYMIQGIVVSSKMKKSIIVVIKRFVKHPMYRKYIERNKRICVHDEHNNSNVGDIVEIKECCPFSKRKSWVLSRIVKKCIF